MFSFLALFASLLIVTTRVSAFSLRGRASVPCSGFILQSWSCPLMYETTVGPDGSLTCFNSTLSCVYAATNDFELDTVASSAYGRCAQWPVSVASCSEPCESPVITYECHRGWFRYWHPRFRFCRKNPSAGLGYTYGYYNNTRTVEYAGGPPYAPFSNANAPASMLGSSISCTVPDVARRGVLKRLASMWN